MKTLWQDFRFGIRILTKQPLFAIIAIITLALGISVNTTMFSIVNGVLLRPLPFYNPDQLVILDEASPKKGLDSMGLSYPDYVDWQKRSQSFESLAIVSEESYTLSQNNVSEHINGARVSASYFALLGVKFLQGRPFNIEEDSPGVELTAIISESLRKRYFADSQRVIGQTIKLNGEIATIVGVVVGDFKFPGNAEIWVPFRLTYTEETRGTRFLLGIGRLKPEISIEQAKLELNNISQELTKEHPQANADIQGVVVAWREAFVSDIRPKVLLLFGAVGFVLLIACANVGNLMLARLSTRSREMAVRVALGATRKQIISQLFIESILLSGMGGFLGLLFSIWTVDWLISSLPDVLPVWMEFSLDWNVLIFTSMAVIATAVIFGLLPAFQASNPELSQVLKDSSRTCAGGKNFLSNILVVGEVALALVLLISATLMMKSFINLQEVNPGFNKENLLTGQLELPQIEFPKDEQKINFYKQLWQQLNTIPDVESIALTSNLPFSNSYSGRGFTVENKDTDYASLPICFFSIVSPNYFSTMGITLIKGREFNENDTLEKEKVAIIDQQIAARFFPTEDPIGKRLKFGGPKSNAPWVTIVGVVNTIHHTDLKKLTRVNIYTPYQQNAKERITIVAKTKGGFNSLASAIKSKISTLHPEIAFYEVKPMKELISNSIIGEQSLGLLFGIFALLALILSAIGIYGVISWFITQRTHEIGIRIALGAKESDVLKLVIFQGMRLAILGVIIGIAASFGMAVVMKSLLFEVNIKDPITFLIVPLLLLVVAFLACYIPARRAVKVDPIVALRVD